MEYTSKKLVIMLDDGNKPEDTVREVLKKLEEGYTSGYYPTFRFE